MSSDSEVSEPWPCNGRGAWRLLPPLALAEVYHLHLDHELYPSILKFKRMPFMEGSRDTHNALVNILHPPSLIQCPIYHICSPKWGLNTQDYASWPGFLYQTLQLYETSNWKPLCQNLNVLWSTGPGFSRHYSVKEADSTIWFLIYDSTTLGAFSS